MINKKLSLIMATIVFATMVVTPIFATHGTNTPTWTESDQEFKCESSLNNLSFTETLDSACLEIEDAADLWTDLTESSWQLTITASSAINQKGEDMGSSGYVAEMVPTELFGTMISAYVRYNTQYDFGDADVDEDIFDFPTVAIHELGHLPVLYHNEHEGDDDSVMVEGIALNEVRRTITEIDEDAVGGIYP